MTSLQALRDFINERLTAAAGEIFSMFQQTIVRYEEEVHRNRLLEIDRKTQIKLLKTESPDRHIGHQKTSSSMEQEEHEAPHIKEEEGGVEETVTDGERDDSHDSVRDWTTQRLTAAAGEIFTVFQQTVVQFQEEMDRQRRLLEITLKPPIKLHRIGMEKSKTNKMPQKRKSYSADYKLQVVKYAVENGNRATGREFGVSEKQVREWRKAEVFLTAMKKTKKANRGLKARWPELEERVHRWVLERRAVGRRLSAVQVRLHAVAVAKEMGISDFAGGPSWGHRFMQRNRLSVRAQMAARLQPPADFQENVDGFRGFIEKLRTEHDVSPDHIINMDEIPLTLEVPVGRTAAGNGQEAVTEKSHFTVVLACCGDGSKLPPMVIFKQKTMPKDEFTPTVAVAVNEKGWMDQEMMEFWLTKCYRKRPDGLSKTRKALLVMDSIPAHTTPKVTEKIKACNSIPAIIPGGLNKLLQPLDISVNRSFKTALRHQWEEWMAAGEQSFTATGRRRQATFQEVVGWIDKAWTSVTTRTVLSEFRKVGITRTDAESDDSLAEEEVTLHLPPELAELFVSDTEDEDFDGFGDVR